MPSLFQAFLLAVYFGHRASVVGYNPRADNDVLQWIDPLIGSKSGGNVFAGVTLPYGMAKGNICLSHEVSLADHE
jgi:hypothetical protein